MSSLLKWKQAWAQPGASSLLLYEELWTEAWLLEQSEDLDATGHSSVSGDVAMWIDHDIGDGTMDTAGHSSVSAPGLDFTIPGEHVVSGSMAMSGYATVDGDLDFEEPFFVDPPLLLTTAGHATVEGTISNLIDKSIGSGSMSSVGHVGMTSLGVTYTTAVVKQLFNVSLATVGRTTIAGSVTSTTVKEIGSGTMAMGGRSTIAQSGFQIQAPAPYTHPLGDASMTLIGFAQLVGDPLWTDQPPFDLGSVTIALNGYQTLSTGRLFGGGIFNIEPVVLSCYGHTTLRSAFSYPGFDFASTEIVATYEGLSLPDDAVAVLEEGDEVSA